MNSKPRIQNQKGAAFIWTLILFFVITTLSASAIFIARQDTMEAINHEMRLKTYYIALGGTDIGYAALTKTVSGNPYIDQFIADPSKTETDTIDIVIDGEQIGSAVVTLDSVNVTVGTETKRWVRVTSVGTLTGETLAVTSIIRINPDNTRHIIREDETP